MRLNRISLAVLAGMLLASAAAEAADNAIIITPGSGVTLRSKDIGAGVQSPIDILGDTSGNPIYGTAGTANANALTVQGIAGMTPVAVSVASGQVAAGAIASGAAVDGWNVTEGAKADAAYAGSGSASIVALLKGQYAALVAALPAGTNLLGKVGIDQTTPGTTNEVVLPSEYPFGATALSSSATGTTGATTATLTPVSGHTAFICGYSVRANATAAADVNDTVVGLLGGTATHLLWVAPLASGVGVDEQLFKPCRPASAVTTNIVVNSGAPGSGGDVSVDAWGYSL